MPSFFETLRVHHEPCEYVDERAVHDALVAQPLAYLDYLHDSLTAIASGRIVVEQPPKQVFADAANDGGPTSAGGDFRVMPCIVRRESRVWKTVKVVGTNVVQKTVPDQITVGKALCIDAAENHITHIFEACLLSSARTGACAAIALKQLAVSRRRVSVVGAGRVGSYAAFYASTLQGVEEVTFVDRLADRARAAAALATETFKSAAVFRAGEAGSPIEADAVIVATTAHIPIVAPAATLAPLVVSVGADAPLQHELSREWAAVADVYVDTLDGFGVGDLLEWQHDGLLQRSAVIDLVSLYRDGPRAGTRPRVFISTGSALFDNLTISYILEGRS
jgi:ornithine cyclodeaminase/alanine dehydrogenase-like protein (mu-crystallin family)